MTVDYPPGTVFTEEQLKMAVGTAIRNRDAALNDAITLSMRVAELAAQVDALQAQVEERDRTISKLQDELAGL